MTFFLNHSHSNKTYKKISSRIYMYKEINFKDHL